MNDSRRHGKVKLIILTLLEMAIIVTNDALMCHNCIAWSNDLENCDSFAGLADSGLVDIPDPEEWRSCATIVVTLGSGQNVEKFTILTGLSMDEFEDEKIINDETSDLSTKFIQDDGVCYIFTKEELEYFTNIFSSLHLNIEVDLARVCVCKSDFCNGDLKVLKNMLKNSNDIV